VFVGEFDVQEALPAHLCALLAHQRHVRRALDQPLLDGERAQRAGGGAGRRIFWDVDREHAAVQAILALDREQEHAARRLVAQQRVQPRSVEVAASTTRSSRSATYRKVTPVEAICAGTSLTTSDSLTPSASATCACGSTSPNFTLGKVIQKYRWPSFFSPRTGTGPTFSSSVKFSAPPGTRPSLARTQAVPTVGWPAKGSSLNGVKMRTRAACVGSSGGRTKVVSEKFISRAMRCMVSAERSRPSSTTASWLPASGFSVNTSTMRIWWG